jgi:HAD superfamily hydrolase (TIGR01509 family)
VISGVLFDFHGTLAQVEEPGPWVRRAAATCGHDLTPERSLELAEELIAAGRAGGPFPEKVPAHLSRLWEDRDLDAASHRACYTGLAGTVETGIEGLPDALYDRLLVAAGWVAYPDAAPVLSALRDAGIRVAVVSNIGFDLRPITVGLGLDPFVDHYALSYEAGVCKPDPAIFLGACDALGVAPGEALMVGDTPADAGAVAAGIRSLVLPVHGPDEVHGLDAVLRLTAP